MPGRDGGVRLGPDAGDQPDQDGLLAGDQPLEPVDVVEVVDDDGADPGAHGHLEVRVGLGIPVHDDVARGYAAGQGQHELTRAGDVDAEPFLRHDAVAGRAGERLRREEHLRPRPPRRQLVAELPGPRAQGGLVDHVRRRAELRRDVVEPDASDDEHPVVVLARARREEPEQVGLRGTHDGTPLPAAARNV